MSMQQTMPQQVADPSRTAGGNGPVLVVDTREKRPLWFTHLPSIPGTLRTGDYSARGMEAFLTVERKSIPDFLNSISGRERERFFAELERMTPYRTRYLLIIGTGRELAAELAMRKLTREQVAGTICAIRARFCPVQVVETPSAGAAFVESLAVYLWAEQCRKHGMQPQKAEVWARAGALDVFREEVQSIAERSR